MSKSFTHHSIVVGTLLHFHTSKHVAEQNTPSLVALHVSHMASGRSLGNEGCCGVQTFCCLSEGLATWDYLL